MKSKQLNFAIIKQLYGGHDSFRVFLGLYLEVPLERHHHSRHDMTSSILIASQLPHRTLRKCK
jgi:hypothetical protein